MLLLIAIILVGTAALMLDLGNRLFGSYARSAFGSAWRITLIVSLCLLMLVPLAGWFVLPDNTVWRALLAVDAAIAGLVTFLYLRPPRAGIHRFDTLRTFTPLTAGGNRFAVCDTTLPIRNLPIPSLTCLVISDIHLNTVPIRDGLDAALAAIDMTAIDLVLVLGDFGEKRQLLPGAAAILARRCPRQRTFCILGNHDYESGREPILREALANAGLTLLTNASHHVPELNVTLLAIDRPWRPADVSVPTDAFVIGLTHSPDNLAWFALHNVPICFAGHTHGGFIRLPALGPLLLPSRLAHLPQLLL